MTCPGRDSSISLLAFDRLALNNGDEKNKVAAGAFLLAILFYDEIFEEGVFGFAFCDHLPNFIRWIPMPWHVQAGILVVNYVLSL